MESVVESQTAAELAPTKRGFRLSFGLGHLLTLMAGLGVGMAIMQPWKTWERPPAPVDYEVAVVSVPADFGKDMKGGEAVLQSRLLSEFGPSSKPAEKEAVDKLLGTSSLSGKLLGTSSLSTIEGEAGVMEVTIPLRAAQGRTSPDKFKIEVKPYSVRGKIRTGVTANFSWAPTTSPEEHLVTQTSGATEIVELAQTSTSSESNEAVRIFLVITPQNAEKRQFTIQTAPASNSPAKK